ncbi:MAG: mismatch repair ATPase (MutS family), partial [uncultured archaeon A07HR67]
TLFATHYHELTTLADHLPRVENVHVAVDERDGDVTFLRTVRDGPTNRSYGVHVADLAGVPDPVVDRAGRVLDRLREEKAIEAKGGRRNGTGETATKQAVFDLSTGSFAGENRAADGAGSPRADTADGAGSARTDTATGSPGETAGHDREPADGIDADTKAVIEELSEVDVAETAPVELLARVKEWQERVE